MKRAAFALALCACHTDAPVQAPHVAAVAPGDAAVAKESEPVALPPPVELAAPVAGSAPCSPGDLGATGKQLAPRPLDACQAIWDRVDDITSQAREAAMGMQSSEGPIKPPKEHVITARKDETIAAVEITSQKQFDKLVTCSRRPAIDWTRDHVWALPYERDDATIDVGSVIDDGKNAVIGVNAGGRGGCGGAAPTTEHAVTLTLVSAGRNVALAACTDTEPPEHCTGLEK